MYTSSPPPSTAAIRSARVGLRITNTPSASTSAPWIPRPRRVCGRGNAAPSRFSPSAGEYGASTVDDAAATTHAIAAIASVHVRRSPSSAPNSSLTAERASAELISLTPRAVDTK